jgi:hypothetical protein
MTRLRAGSPTLVPGAAVIPVEESSLSSGATSFGCYVYASKRPAAVIVCQREKTQAFNGEGEALPLDPLLAKVSNLPSVLAECRRKLNE